MTGATRRILIRQGGVLQPRVTGEPQVCGSSCGWSGVRLERHRLQGPGSSKGTIEGFQICLNLTGPVFAEWVVDGRGMSGTLNGGDLCLATHGQYRSVSWMHSYELLLLSLSPRLMEEIGSASGRARRIELQPCRGFRDRTVESLCRLLLADAVENAPAGPMFGEHLACSLACYLAEQLAVDKQSLRRSGRQTRQANALPGPVLRRVCELIEARLSAPIGLPDLAREAQMSRFYFSRLFRNSTGESPYRYLTKRRIEKAKELLSKGWCEAEVATAVGLANTSHLTSLFYRYAGMTPRQYRAELKE